MRHQFTKADGERGRQAATARQAKHDRKCRPVLERAARAARPTIVTGKRLLEEAGVDTPLGGAVWHTGQVWRIANRLGIKLGLGLRPGVLLYCRKCHAGRRNLNASGLCKRCQWKANRAREHRGIREAEIADAKHCET